MDKILLFKIIILFDIFENIFRNHNTTININLNNINTKFSSSINTSTQIIGNKKITRTQKTTKTENGTRSTIEEKVEYI